VREKKNFPKGEGEAIRVQAGKAKKASRVAWVRQKREKERGKVVSKEKKKKRARGSIVGRTWEEGGEVNSGKEKKRPPSRIKGEKGKKKKKRRKVPTFTGQI